MLRSSSSSSSISSLLQISIMVSHVILSPSFKCSSAKVNEPWSTSTNVFEFHFRSTLSQVSLLNEYPYLSSTIINFLIFIFHPVLDLLWVAPEILRLPNRPIRGTQKGDVYSFAIILQEFHTREGPYSSSYMDPKGISKFPYRLVVVVLIL